MRALSENEIVQARKQGRKPTDKAGKVIRQVAPKSKPSQKTPTLEDKQVTATEKILAVVKESNAKADRMANLSYGLANLFVKAIGKIKPQADEKRITEWEMTITKRNDDKEKTIKKVSIKAVG